MYSDRACRLPAKTALALLVAAAFPPLADAVPVARVEFTSGSVSVAGPDGKSRVVGRGSVLESGETIETAAGARAQLRFTDGAYMSLQPQTAFRVDEYRWDGKTDGSEKGVFSLIKGGLRTITGAIGRVNRNAYQVQTAVATIGIRGTEYLVEYTNSIRVLCYNGELGLTNNKVIDFPVPGGRGYEVKSRDADPVPSAGPVLGPEPTPQQRALAQSGPDPVSLPVNPFTGGGGGSFPLPAGSGYALAFSIGGEGNFCQSGCASSGSATCGQPIVTLHASGGLSWTQGPAFTGDFIQLGPIAFEPGTLQFSGGSIGGVLGWGYFSNGSATLISGSGSFLELGRNEGAHGILFIPTPIMPTTGSVTYTLIPGGFTTPTFSNNAGGGGFTPGGIVTAASLTANFGPSTVSGNASISFPGGAASNLSFNATISGAGFVGAGNFTGPAICSTSCSAQVHGGFAGTAGGSPVAPPYAGYVYKVVTPGFSQGFNNGHFGMSGAIAHQR